MHRKRKTVLRRSKVRIEPGTPMFARDYLWGGRYKSEWQKLVHVAHIERANNNIIFRTLCGETFATGTVPRAPHVTCFFCLTYGEIIW